MYKRVIRTDCTKSCTGCGLEKSFACFSRDKNREDGFNYYCKECTRKRNRKSHMINIEKAHITQAKYRKNNKEKCKQSQLKCKQNSPEKYRRIGLYHVHANRDKIKGFQTCTREEFFLVLDVEVCLYCGFRGQIGADRIDNSKGHTKDNIVPCCKICNLARGDRFTFEEMKRYIGPAICRVREERNAAR